MSIYIVNHKVEDFGAWKKAYDDFQPTVAGHGIKDHYVLTSLENKNHVVVIGEGPADVLQSFLNSDELKSAMANAGVSSAPDIYVGEEQS